MCNAFTNALHNATTLMTQNDRKETFWVTATQCVCISMTHAWIQNLHTWQHNVSNELPSAPVPAGGGGRGSGLHKKCPPLGGAVVWVFPNVSLTMCPLKLSLVRLLARLWHQHWLPSHKFIRLFRDTAIEMCFLLNCNVYKTNIHWMFTRNIIYCILWTECDTNYNILFDFLTFIRTSPLLGGATSTVSKVNGFFAAQATAALHVIACKITTKHNC